MIVVNRFRVAARDTDGFRARLEEAHALAEQAVGQLVAALTVASG